MAHPRKTIRSTIKTALVTAATAAAGRVFTGRRLPLRVDQLPAICIYTDNEESDDEQTAPRELTRVVELTINGYVADTDEVEDEMDDLAEEIETAMHADPHFGSMSLIADSMLTSTVAEVGKEGDRHVGRIVMTYDVTYYTLAPAAPSSLDDFTDVHAEHNVNDAETADQAEDDFVVQEVA